MVTSPIVLPIRDQFILAASPTLRTLGNCPESAGNVILNPDNIPLIVKLGDKS